MRCTNRLNIKQMYALSTKCIYVFCTDLRTNSDLCHLHHKLTGFYNRYEKCLLCGTKWVFKYNRLRFAFKELIMRQIILSLSSTPCLENEKSCCLKGQSMSVFTLSPVFSKVNDYEISVI